MLTNTFKSTANQREISCDYVILMSVLTSVKMRITRVAERQLHIYNVTRKSQKDDGRIIRSRGSIKPNIVATPAAAAAASIRCS